MTAHEAKAILIVFDADSFPYETLDHLGRELLMKGFVAFMLRCSDYPNKFNLFDLSNLSPVELEEIRELCRKSMEDHA